ncbi:pyridoxamine 5'-phosphate oxidase [Verrucomicrobiota bacterium]|nr:pyridoxamine 5'-phosphate oxidase [Verrucomicrobiota bacterium]
MNWHTTDLPDLLRQIQHALHAAPADAANPLRTAAFITAPDSHPAARTVVLRRADTDTRQLFFYTDTRSAKLRELAQNPAVAWLFHHPGEQMQIRAEGTAALHPADDFARAAWAATPPLNRLNYCATLPPGTPVDNPDAGLPAAWRHREPTREETETGWANFAVVVTTLTRLDWLLLRPQGTRRACFQWDGTAWSAHWLVP